MSKLSGAGVVELADALDSKSSGSDTVWVQLPPPAPKWRFLGQKWLKNRFFLLFFAKNITKMLTFGEQIGEQKWRINYGRFHGDLPYMWKRNIR